MLCDRYSGFPPLHRKPTNGASRGRVLAFYRIAPCLSCISVLRVKRHKVNTSILVYLKDSNAASHFVNSLILFALSRTGILFAHAPQKNVSNRWYASALRVRKSQNGSGFNNFSAMFPFATCVKESQNQPNGFVESRRKSQPSPFQKVKA